MFRISVRRLLLLVVVAGLCGSMVGQTVRKKGYEIDIRSHGREMADDVLASGNAVTADAGTPLPGVNLVPQIQLRGGNVQVNDPALDNIQVFPGFRPFVEYTQSETSIAAHGSNIVAAYNSSANQPLVLLPPLVFTQRFLSGYSVSADGGQTWTSGFFPPMPGSIFTFGDPVAGKDRRGSFYFAGLGADAVGLSTIQVNTSTDGGQTWGPAVQVQQDNGGDKEWMAVGPDPFNKSRDNVYVSWTSFQPTGQQLRFGKSVDGGATFTAKTIFAPAADPDPTHPQNSLQSSNIVVDPKTGFIYIPFARFSNSDIDFIQVMVSYDAGENFQFLKFNAAGAPSDDLLPIVQAGHLIDCGVNGGLRLSIHSGTATAGRFGLPRFREASRLVTQPSMAARNGILYLAWNNSTGSVFGDLASGSNIMFVRSDNGGQTWSAPLQVNPSSPDDTMHVLPSLAIDSDPQDVHVLYYTQHVDGTVSVDLANSHDRGSSFPANRTARVTGSPFQLAPTNVTQNATTTTNFDRTIRPCYGLGEYLSATAANGTVYGLWGDMHNTVMQPVNPLDPISGLVHTQADVVFQAVKAQ